MGIEGHDGPMMQLDEKDPIFPLDDDDDDVNGELDLVTCEGEPYEGMEFDSEEAARVFYSSYARNVGFRTRISRYTRSRRDNSIISRLIVCSKEGFRESRGNGGDFGERKQPRQRAVTRIGCKALLMVKKLVDGKWVVSKFIKEHNHGPVPPRKVEVRLVRKEEDRIEERSFTCSGGVVNEPLEGMEFDSEDDARTFYIDYARQMGFRARISKYCRSRKDNLIISRQIVCSKEGFREVRIKETDDGRVKRPRMVTRVGCKAMIIVKKLNTGKWVIARFEKEHNHALVTSKKVPLLLQSLNDHTDKGGDMLSNSGIMGNDDSVQGASCESLTVLYNQLYYEATRYAEEGAVSEEIFDVAMGALKEAAEKVAAAKRNVGTGGQGISQGHGSNEAKKRISANEIVFMQQPLKFVLIPSSSLADDLEPADQSVESSAMLKISNGQGIIIPTVLKQSSSIAYYMKELAGNGITEHTSAGEKSKKLDNLVVGQAKITPATTGNKLIEGISDNQMVAFPALPVTVYMPVMGSLAESSSGTAASNAYTLVAAPMEEASPVATGAQPRVSSNIKVEPSATPAKDKTPRTCTRPNPQVHATAIAAGARVIPPHEAASLIKAIEARVRNSRSAPGFGYTQSRANVSHGNSEEGPTATGKQEPGEGLKEMDLSAVYDSACDDHLISDCGS